MESSKRREMERNQLREGEKQEEREKQKKSWIVAKGERKRGYRNKNREEERCTES